jgi:hypothetical protein
LRISGLVPGLGVDVHYAIVFATRAAPNEQGLGEGITVYTVSSAEQISIGSVNVSLNVHSKETDDVANVRRAVDAALTIVKVSVFGALSELTDLAEAGKETLSVLPVTYEGAAESDRRINVVVTWQPKVSVDTSRAVGVLRQATPVEDLVKVITYGETNPVRTSSGKMTEVPVGSLFGSLLGASAASHIADAFASQGPFGKRPWPRRSGL